jgi:RNA polymerase sigma factor for flagellar operon FliA
MNVERFFIDHLDEIDQAIAFVCRRHDIRGADAEDFASSVKLKIIDNDYAVIRKFQSRATFHGYLIVVITRFLIDERNHNFGKWRPSAEAKRLGETAVFLETLLRRDKRTLDDALALIRARGTAVTRMELEALAEHFPARKPRPREISLDTAELHVAPATEAVVGAAEEGERTQLARKAATALRGAMERLPEQDRVIFRMHFGANMTVAEIARVLRLPQKPVYRLLTTQLKNFRRIVERAGINARNVDDIIGMATTPLDGDLGEAGGAQSVIAPAEE